MTSTGRGAAIGQTATAPSAAGLRFIGRFEGFSGNLYDDPAGNCTIGFGHLVHLGRTNGSEPPELCAGITRRKALELLRADASQAAEAVRTHVTLPLTQPQFDALVSFTYNVGPEAFAGSTLLRLLNAGDRGAVPAQLLRWTRAEGRPLPGLVRRRAAEARLFAQGIY